MRIYKKNPTVSKYCNEDKEKAGKMRVVALFLFSFYQIVEVSAKRFRNARTIQKASGK